MTTRTEEGTKQKSTTTTQATAPREYRSANDPALLYAWQLYISYDAASNRQKFWHSTLRSWIIIAGLLTSTLAIGSALPYLGIVFTELTSFVRLLLIALPIAIAGMMTFASQFTPSLAWILYRVAAETIRREIYLYRMKSGEYSDEKEPDILKKQEKFIANVEKANNQVDELNTVIPFLQRLELDGEQIREYIKTKKLTDTPKDDGFSPLTGVQYVEWRIIPQRNWYIHRINDDYKKLRLSRMYMIAIAGFGSLLAAIGGGFEHYVVITTAAGLAASTYVQLRMFGQTYIGYHLTAKKLDMHIARWMMYTEEEKNAAVQVDYLVHAMEDIFQDERMTWMQVSIQAQTSGEQALIKNIGDWTTSRFGLVLPSEEKENEAPTSSNLIAFTTTHPPEGNRESTGRSSSSASSS